MERGTPCGNSCDERRLTGPHVASSPPPCSPSQSLPLPIRTSDPVTGSIFIHSPTIVGPDSSRIVPQPTLSQSSALSSVARLHPREVIGSIKTLKCLDACYKHHGGLAPFTPAELGAFSELKDCREEHLLAWLGVTAQNGEWCSL